MKKPYVVVVGAAWYGEWAKSVYLAYERLGFRIAIVYNNSLPALLGGSRDATTHVFESAKRMVKKLLPWAFSSLKGIRQHASEKEIIAQVKARSADEPCVVVFVWTPGSERVLKKLKCEKNIKLVLWLGEPTVRDATWEPLFDYFDEVFIVDQGLWVDNLQPKNKARAKLLTLAGDDIIFHRLEASESAIAVMDKKLSSEVSFIGKYLSSRAEWLSALKDRDLKIYGYGWEEGFAQFPWLKEKYIGPVTSEEANIIYNNTQVAIGTLGSPKDPYTTATQRTFEIALAGAFQICEYVRLTEELFSGSIKIYRSQEEFVGLVNYYLSHPEERKSLADQAHQIALHHTYTVSAEKILEAVMEKQNGQVK